MNFHIQVHAYVVHFFLIIKTYIFHLIKVVFIVINLQKFWCFMIHRTYFFGFIQQDIIHHLVNNSVFFLLFMESLNRYRVAPTVLRKMGCSILSPKSPQDLTFVGRMSSAVDDTDFIFYLRAIYILFTALASNPIRRRVSI